MNNVPQLIRGSCMQISKRLQQDIEAYILIPILLRNNIFKLI